MANKNQFNGGMLTMGICIGAALGAAFENIPIGLAIGTTVGIGMWSLPAILNQKQSDSSESQFGLYMQEGWEQLIKNIVELAG